MRDVGQRLTGCQTWLDISQGCFVASLAAPSGGEATGQGDGAAGASDPSAL